MRRYLIPPADPVELADAPACDRDAFRHQQRPLERFAAAVTAEPAPGGDHPVARHVRDRLQPRMMLPTARAARGRPASLATSP